MVISHDAAIRRVIIARARKRIERAVFHSPGFYLYWVSTSLLYPRRLDPAKRYDENDHELKILAKIRGDVARLAAPRTRGGSHARFTFIVN